MSIVENLQCRLRSLTSVNSVQNVTLLDQRNTENSLRLILQSHLKEIEISSEYPVLKRLKHIQYLQHGLHKLPESFECLDASLPWLCYWILHSLEILEAEISSEDATALIDFLKRCQHKEGGFGGGPSQFPHLAATYAAVNALCILGTVEAYSVINRTTLLSFLRRMHQPDGSFTLHEGGEVDIRGVYCALAVARLTELLTEDLRKGTDIWILRCQTYEGGFSGYPGLEAHGGYTFCGYAGLVLLGSEELCDARRVLHWVAFKQMVVEGGFQGRTNKLVDSCYSFWVGAVFTLIHRRLESLAGGKSIEIERWLFDVDALQQYVMLCCEKESGGFIDKPSKHRDFYHTCYSLSGISIAQHSGVGSLTSMNVLGHPDNEVLPIHPVFNIGAKAAALAHEYFKSLSVLS